MVRCAAGVWLLMATLGASAQYTAKKIVFSNMGPYSQQDLEAAAGLHVGQTLTPTELGAAAQRLSDTSRFENIEATLDGPIKAVTVLVKEKPIATTQMLRAGFANFVWLTPDEVTAAIRAQAPLYDGFVPEGGNQADAITAALQQVLKARGITATVDHADIEPSFGHPVRVMEFSAARHPVVTASVALKGIAPDMQAAMQKQVAAVQGKRYREGLGGNTVADFLLMPYLDLGYITAKLGDFERTPSEAADRTNVSLRATVNAGDSYKVSTLTFSGTQVISATDFAKTVKLKPDDVASHHALLDSLAPIDQAYRNLGYLDEVTEAVPTLDQPALHVAYAITVQPGTPYRVGTVTPQGLSPAAQADFDRGWRMIPGQIYNPSYVASFLKQNTALRALQGYSAGFHASADPDTHLVDLTINFVGSR